MEKLLCIGRLFCVSFFEACSVALVGGIAGAQNNMVHCIAGTFPAWYSGVINEDIVRRSSKWLVVLQKKYDIAPDLYGAVVAALSQVPA